MDELSLPQAGAALQKVHLPVEERYARLPGQGAQIPCLRTNSPSHGPTGSDFGGDRAEDPRDAPPLRERIEEAAGGEVAQPLLSNLATVVLRSASISLSVPGLRRGGRVARSYIHIFVHIRR
ncbi:hypothetical protein K0M31_009730 [Melipona bicolor]|uniref:Uncharacterized protein n=1 Tax=Melipona bicolor TaxID=60889 RepID=A0AA40KJB4_9HYME|nr:hypothetical protein K0M31_009733 [Melipona bicolor]KAK1122510.1 hypothetical protein K0M31_009730 [Melipona bicolor]